MPCAADVDPRAGGHLAVHRQPEVLEPAELVPRRPFGHEVRVGDQHARRPLVRAEDADRLARLDEQRLVARQRRAACARSRRTPPTSARRGRCRRRRRGPPGARRRPGRGCSSACACAASCGQPAQDSSLPRGARIVRRHAQRSDLGFDGARAARPTRPAPRRPPGRARASGPAPGRPRARAARAARRRVPAPGRQRRAQVEPVRRRRPARPRGSAPRFADARRAACAPRPSPSRRGPPASRSSAASRRWRARRAAGSRPPSPPACTGRSSARSSRPRRSVRNGGSPCERVASSSRSVRRSAIAPTSAAAIARKSQANAERRAVEVAARLDAAVGQHHRVVDRRHAAPRPPRARRASSVSRAAPVTCGAQRSE